MAEQTFELYIGSGTGTQIDNAAAKVAAMEETLSGTAATIPSSAAVKNYVDSKSSINSEYINKNADNFDFLAQIHTPVNYGIDKITTQTFESDGTRTTSISFEEDGTGVAITMYGNGQAFFIPLGIDSNKDYKICFDSNFNNSDNKISILNASTESGTYSKAVDLLPVSSQDGVYHYETVISSSNKYWKLRGTGWGAGAFYIKNFTINLYGDVKHAIIKRNTEIESNNYDIENDIVKGYTRNVNYSDNDYSYSSVNGFLVDTSYRKDQPKAIKILAHNSCVSVVISDNPSYINPITISVVSGEAVVNNLIPQNFYYYKEIDSYSKAIYNGTFIVEGFRRFIKEDSLFNIRDIGGIPSSTGRLQYSKIIRGCELDNATQDDLTNLLNIVGITAEIDLRENKPESKFGDNVEYENISIGAYTGVVDHLGSNPGNSAYRHCFKVLLDFLRNNKTVYIHCAGGADRTGTLVLLLELLCGVSESDAIKDWEMTSFSIYSVRTRTNTTDLSMRNTIANLKERAGNTIQQKCRAWWLETNGNYTITEAELDEFITYMT